MSPQEQYDGWEPSLDSVFPTIAASVHLLHLVRHPFGPSRTPQDAIVLGHCTILGWNAKIQLDVAGRPPPQLHSGNGSVRGSSRTIRVTGTVPRQNPTKS